MWRPYASIRSWHYQLVNSLSDFHEIRCASFVKGGSVSHTPKLAPVCETGTPERLPMDKPPQNSPIISPFPCYMCLHWTSCSQRRRDAFTPLSVSVLYDKHFNLGEASLTEHTWQFPSTAIYDHTLQFIGINAPCSEPIQIWQRRRTDAPVTKFQ